MANQPSTLDDLRKRAVEGACGACGKPTPPSSKERVVCNRKSCKALYRKLYGDQYRGPSAMKRIVERKAIPGTRAIQERLECGHTNVAFRHSSRDRDSRRCLHCLQAIAEAKEAATATAQ